MLTCPGHSHQTGFWEIPHFKSCVKTVNPFCAVHHLFPHMSNDSILLMYYKISQAYTQIYSLNKSFDFDFIFCICWKILISKLPLRHSYARTLSLSSPAPNIQSENALRLILSSSNVIFISKAFFSPLCVSVTKGQNLKSTRY